MAVSYKDTPVNVSVFKMHYDLTASEFLIDCENFARKSTKYAELSKP